MEYFYSALDYIVSVFGSIYDFFATIPDLFLDAFTYAWFWFIKLYIYLKIQMLEMAYNVASLLLSEYEVYTVLNMAFNKLPSDLRFACYQFGIVDSVRIVVDAFATAFVLRIMGW
ncbi:hypothetical protein AB4283_20005 [Vibrio splendidus]